jgi:polyisoprenoid-binding protein YceI
VFKKFALLSLLAFSQVAFAADHYKIDPDHTYSSFEYRHWGLSTQRGRFDKTSGAIELDIDAGTGSIQIDIDANSISTGSDAFNKVMKSSTFFDTEAFPKITFTSTKLNFSDKKLMQIEGNLTIKDITKPIVLEVSQFECRFVLLYLNHACGANGQAKISRSDFKLWRYVPFVGDEITLYFSVEGIRE